MAKKKSKKKTAKGARKPSAEQIALEQRQTAAKDARKRAKQLEKDAKHAEAAATARAADFEAITEKFRRRIAKAESELRQASKRAEVTKHHAADARAEADRLTLLVDGGEHDQTDLTPPLPTGEPDAPLIVPAVEDNDPARSENAADDTAAPQDELTAQQVTPPLPHAESADEPSEAWTVVKLRALARERGVTGIATKNKVQLIEALRN